MSKKVIFYSILVALLVVGGILVYPSCSKSVTKSLQLSIFSVNGKFDTTHVIEFANDVFSDDLEKITLTINGDNKWEKDKPTGIGNETDYRQEFFKALRENLKANVVRKSPEEVNAIISNFTRAICNSKVEQNNCFILTGAFPANYTKKDAEKSIKSVEEDLKDFRTEASIKILLALETNNSDPEKILIERFGKLQGGNTLITNKCINVPTRIIDQNSLTNVYAIFFTPLKDDAVIEFANHLSNLGNNINLKIWSDDKFNDKNIVLTRNDSFKDSLNKTLPFISKSSWSSIAYLIKQAINKFDQANDDLPKLLFIVGNMPPEGKGNLLEPSTWKTLKGIKKLKIVKFIPSSATKNSTDKDFYEGLKQLNINIIEN